MHINHRTGVKNRVEFSNSRIPGNYELKWQTRRLRRKNEKNTILEILRGADPDAIIFMIDKECSNPWRWD